ncbi:hypothetical protein DV113_001125 [Geotrichum candidum]|nr:hypothetical protein DV454_000025 [Geotrichum candidum]KAF7500815.1 hypothetical protein DV113_001125 [Geotrichum candidum]
MTRRPALIAFVTAGYPSVDETIPILHALQDGGADIIELGIPFTDPIADGPTIQTANNIALANGVNTPTVLKLVRDARASGITVPLMLMGYYNPMLQYGEKRMVQDARAAGANGFIVVDLPPEEAVHFRNLCVSESLSFIPLVAPSTVNDRLAHLATIADSFIYVASRMGTTGARGSLEDDLPEYLARIRELTKDIPLAVGFGISTKEHVDIVGKNADGAVIGSRIITTIEANNTPETRAAAVKAYISEVVGGRKVTPLSLEEYKKVSETKLLSTLAKDNTEYKGQFGEFGGQYVPEAMHDCLKELVKGFEDATNSEEFWEEFRSYYPYMNRPSNLHEAPRLTEYAGGAKIWLKREDLNHTGSHKINNALGQCLIAKRLGKKNVIAETGAGQHGVATATVCAKFGLKCTVFMGAEDVRRQGLNVFRMKMLGADVVPVESGSKTLRDAVNEALRFWVTNLSTTHYIIGSAIGPHPYPLIVKTFQSVIGKEAREQFMKLNNGALPDAVVACVGGGSNCVGMFSGFEHDPSVKLLGVEAGGDGMHTEKHSATLTRGQKGVLHGVMTYVLQDKDGQVQETHSVSAGLDYPAVGPELSNWKDTGRAEFTTADDAQAMLGFKLITQLEGIMPALESAHAVHGALELAKTMKPEENVIICLSGRGDKDVHSVAETLPKLGPKIGWDLRFEGSL